MSVRNLTAEVQIYDTPAETILFWHINMLCVLLKTNTQIPNPEQGQICTETSTPFYPQIKIKGVQIKIKGIQIKISPYLNFMSRDFNLKSSYFNLNSFYFNLRVKRCSDVFDRLRRFAYSIFDPGRDAGSSLGP